MDNTKKGHVYYTIKALLTNDLFDPCFNDEICEEKITDSLKVAQRQMSSLKSPSAKRVVSVSMPVNFFFRNFEEHERDQDQVMGFEPLPSEHEDIKYSGCVSGIQSAFQGEKKVQQRYLVTQYHFTMISRFGYIACPSLAFIAVNAWLSFEYPALLYLYLKYMS